MRQASLVILAAAMALGSGAAFADPLSDAKAGLDALNRGDNDAAIRLFSEALNAGGLAPSDMELAYVKRAEAYAAEKNVASASSDLDAAAKLDPTDQEIGLVRQSLQRSDAGPSIDETLKYIVNQINSGPTVSYILLFPPFSDGTTHTRTEIVNQNNVAYNAENCSIIFVKNLTLKSGEQIANSQPQSIIINFSSYQNSSPFIVADAGSDNIRLLEEEIKRLSTNPKYAGMSGSAELAAADAEVISFLQNHPPIVDAYTVGGAWFQDEEVATRVANAMNHAGELCAKPDTPDPFESRR